ncbi:helix-turn-helix domain-containing protein [Streptomyces chartreusis]|uniref:helix-turn-helix domain-containing protein n=1 Tax=Streptomyces chartreusis TaxID=1969 RepID=UPI0035E232E4
MTATSYERVIDSLEAAFAGLERTGCTASTATDEDALALRSAMADLADHLRRPITIPAVGRRLRPKSGQALSFPALAADPDRVGHAHILIVACSPGEIEVLVRQPWREMDQSTIRLLDFPGVAGKGRDALGGPNKAAHTPLPHARDLKDSFPALKSAESFVTSAGYAELITDQVEAARNIGPDKASRRTAAPADQPARNEEDTVSHSVDPSLNRRNLRIALRQARQKAGMSQQDVAQDTQWSPSKLLRIERGTVGVSVVDLRTLMALYGIDDVEQMRDLEEAARKSKGPSWWSRHSEVVSPGFAAYLQFEQEAESHRLYHPVLRPAPCPVLDAYIVVPDVAFRWGTEFRADGYEQGFGPGGDVGGMCAPRNGAAWWRPLAESVTVPPRAEQLTCAFPRRDTFPAGEATGLHSAFAPWHGRLSGASLLPRVPATPSLLVPSSQQPEAGASGLRMPLVRAACISRKERRTAGERTKEAHQAFGICADPARRGSGRTCSSSPGGQASPGATCAGRWMPSRARRRIFQKWQRCVAEPNAACSLQHRATPPTARSARGLAGCRCAAKPRGHTRGRPGAGT